MAFIRGSVSEAKNVYLFSPNCLTQRQSPHYDYTNIFFSSFAVVLPKHVGIDHHPIDQIDDKQPPYVISSHLPALQ